MEKSDFLKRTNFACTESAKWLRSRDVREMLSISDSTLQTLRITGSIKAYKLGGSWFYREEEIISALQAGSTKRKEAQND